jgi:hypothetical protein
MADPGGVSVMKLTQKTQSLLIIFTGLVLAAAPLAFAEYAFAKWGDNGAAMLFFMPVSGSLLMLSFWGGGLLSIFGAAMFAATVFKRRQ